MDSKSVAIEAAANDVAKTNRELRVFQLTLDELRLKRKAEKEKTDDEYIREKLLRAFCEIVPVVCGMLKGGPLDRTEPVGRDSVEAEAILSRLRVACSLNNAPPLKILEEMEETIKILKLAF